MIYDKTMCWKCRSPITDSEPISRSASCPSCGADLRSCRNCQFYAPGSHYDCHETIDELVKDKEHANFCDSFKVKREWGGEASSAQSKADAARSAFQGLFGN